MTVCPHSATRRRFVTATLVCLAMLGPVSIASAALPPFELVEQSLAAARNAGEVELAFDVTVARERIETYRLQSTKPWGAPATLTASSAKLPLSEKSDIGLRMLWIALLSSDPVVALAVYGRIDTQRAEVGVGDDFVYIYGTNPRIAVYRDLQRVAWFEVSVKGQKWRTSITHDDKGVAAVTVTRDAAPYINARRRP